MSIDSQQIIEDLGKMAFLLNNCGICSDNSAFSKMQNDMRTLPEGVLWQYGSQEETYDFVVFQIPKMSHTRPEDIDNITISLAVRSKGSKDMTVGQNHFLQLDMQLVLSAFALDSDCIEKTVKSAWHMDMDTSPDNDYVHPLFHINFGGRELEALGDTGEILLLRSPRLMHPPMDIFLAVDFVVQNFFGRQHSLFQDTDYQKLINKYRAFHWRSYALALASNFHTSGNENVDSTFAKNILGN